MGGLDHVPDVRDGLTHVERRLLHALPAPKTTRRKSGAVIDAARQGTDLSRIEVYDALVRLTQDWSLRYPLVSGRGNFGSIDDDPAASPVYTEVRLARRADGLFGPGDPRLAPGADPRDIDHVRPLSGPFPNLLANGASEGIACFPPHLLGELAAALILRLDDPAAGLDELLAVMPGPDYPTGGQLVDLEEIRAAYETGTGSIRLRGVAVIEVGEPEDEAWMEQDDEPWSEAGDEPWPEAEAGGEDAAGSWVISRVAPGPSQLLVFTAIPFGTRKGGEHGLINEAADLVRDGVLQSICDIQDYSDRTGMRLVFGVRDDADPSAARDLLFEHTSLESELRVLMVALVDGKPEQLTLLDAIDHYLAHQRASRRGSRAEVDAAIRRDLQALAARKSAGRRRTALPGAAGSG